MHTDTGAISNKRERILLVVTIISSIMTICLFIFAVTIPHISSDEGREQVTETEDVEDITHLVSAEFFVEEIEQEQLPSSLSEQASDETETEELSESQDTMETYEQESNSALYSGSEFMYLGVIQWDGWRWTWYSEKVLPGGGLDIPGRHNDDDGYVCDENDYICLASSTLSKGTVINTPFGKQGKVYDTGCPTDVVDVYVSW